MIAGREDVGVEMEEKKERDMDSVERELRGLDIDLELGVEEVEDFLGETEEVVVVEEVEKDKKGRKEAQDGSRCR